MRLPEHHAWVIVSSKTVSVKQKIGKTSIDARILSEGGFLLAFWRGVGYNEGRKVGML